MEKKYVNLFNDLASAAREVIRSFDKNYLERLERDKADEQFFIKLNELISEYNNNNKQFIDEINSHNRNIFINVIKLVKDSVAYVELKNEGFKLEHFPILLSIFKSNVEIIDSLAQDYWIAAKDTLRSNNKLTPSIERFLDNISQEAYFGSENKNYKKNGGNDISLIEDKFIEEIMSMELFAILIRFYELHHEGDKNLEINMKLLNEYAENAYLWIVVGFAYVVYLCNKITKYENEFKNIKIGDKNEAK